MTFVAAKAGADPKIKIDNPKNFCDDLTGVTCDRFDDLLEALDGFVEDEDNEMSFHFDKAHSYRIDGRAWEHGTAIYGMKNKEVGKKDGVITKSKLVPLRDADEFRDHVLKIGHRMYDDPTPSYSTRGRAKEMK